MLKKGSIAVACLAVATTAYWSWAGASWQLQTKVGTSGGSIKVRDKAPQTGVSIAYANFTTTTPRVGVTVTPDTGYFIKSITENGVSVASFNNQGFSDNFAKTSGTQTLVASFAPSTISFTPTVNGPGTITSEPVDANGNLVPVTVNYNGSAAITVKPTHTNGVISNITVGGNKYTGVSYPAAGSVTISLANIISAPTVVITCTEDSVNAGTNQHATPNQTVTLNGSAPQTISGATVAWSIVTAPTGSAAKLTADSTGLKPTFKPDVEGTYVFQLTESLGTTVLASSTTTLSVSSSFGTTTTDYFNASCNGCHSPSGVLATNAFANFTSSAHWKNLLNNGDRTVAGDGKGSCATNQCHFKSVSAPACFACHSGDLKADGTFNSQPFDHTTQPMATAANTCEVCHSGHHGTPTTEFLASKHWANSNETSYYNSDSDFGIFYNGAPTLSYPSLTDPAALAVIDPNNSWNTYEWASAKGKTPAQTKPTAPVTCALRCHFKPNLGSNSQATDSTITYTYTAPDGTKTVYARPGKDACVACHDPHKPETATAQSTCYTCHSGGNHGKTVANFLLSTHNTGAHAKLYYQMDQKSCLACHDPHSTEAAFFTMSGATQVKSNTGCQACHAPGSGYDIYGASRTGMAPHFQTGLNSWDTGNSAAYLAAGTQCGDCHGHNNAKNAGWAEGGHGDVNAVPWKGDKDHTDWGVQGVNGVNFQTSPAQTNCIRCHSASGFAAFVDSGFTKIDQIPTSGANAPLTCNACHVNRVVGAADTHLNEGALRLKNFTTASVVGSKKGYKAFWGYSGALATKRIVTSIQLGDNRNSNLCMPCHSQRASGQEIKDFFANGKSNAYTIGTAIYPHAAQPAAIFYGVGGYDFTATNGSGTTDGFGFQDRARHQRIGNYISGGATGYNNTGITQGSCVGCHMTSAPSDKDLTHNLEVGPKDANGNFTAITSTECAKCHPSDFTYQTLNQKKGELQALVTALGNLLVKKGLSLDGVNPLPERTKNFDMSLGTLDNAIAEKNYGAWFNWYLFKTADPGAYAHNPSYARRLLTDSIDWLDDNKLNGSAAVTVQAMATVANNPYYNPTVVTSTVASNAVAYTNDPGCLGCHYGTNSSSANPPGIEQPKHFADPSTTNAQYVASNAQCNNCHGYGHGTDSPGYSYSKAAFPMISSVQKSITADFAEQGHADTTAAAFDTVENFKTQPTCNACHTTTGFVKAIGNSWTDTTAWGTTGDPTAEIIGCNACHSSTAWKTSIRSIAGGYTAGMGGYGSAAKATVKYEDVAESNICIPCHATRENGASLISAVTNFTNASFKNPHYLGAAAVFYGKAGFQFYTSGVRYNRYENERVGRKAGWNHGKLGIANYSTATSTKYPGKVVDSGKQGQCVACHLGPTNGHTFGAYEAAKSTWTTGGLKGCYGCHTSEDMEEVGANELSLFNRGMAFFNYVLKQNGMVYSDAYPYFYAADGTTALKNWTVVGPTGGTGAQNMGAAMNYKVLAAEKGAHVHNRAFARALMADSIVYLQKGAVGDRTVTSTNPNNVISFTSYSSALAANPDGNAKSISDLKGWILRLSGSNYSRR